MRPKPHFFGKYRYLRSGTDAVHTSTANWANTLYSRLTILHGDLLLVGHFTLGLALHTVGLSCHVTLRLSSYRHYRLKRASLSNLHAQIYVKKCELLLN
jgi:hypothetical protein